MLSDISDRLAQVIELKRRKEKLERDLAQIHSRLEQQSAQAAELARQLQKEQVDVQRLERLSLQGLFYSVLGSKEQQVEKERQEMLAAQLQYQNANHQAGALRLEKEGIERELSALSGVDRQYTALLAEKEDFLRRGNPTVAADLLRLTDAIANKASERHEIDEAAAAAEDVSGSLARVIASLESAEGWGTWDMLGGGLLATAVKHSRIDEAREAAHDVQAKLVRFQRELADVQRDANIIIDIGGFEIFADYFFDNLIMDWIVQSKISSALNQSRQAKAQVEQAAARLRQAREEVTRQAERLAEQRRSLIEGA